MVGMMLWEPSGHWTRPVTLKEVSVLHIRFLCARMAQDRRRNPLTERRRLRTAGKKLLRQRVEQVVLPAGASGGSAGGVAPGRDPAASAGHCCGLVRRAAAVPGGKPRRGAGADHGGRPLRRGGADGDGAGPPASVSADGGAVWRGGTVPSSAAGIRRVHRAEPGDGAGAGVCPHGL